MVVEPKRLAHFIAGTVLTACCLGVLLSAIRAEAFQLITPEEAALPPGHTPTLEFRGSPTRRPSVTVVSPPPGAGLLHSPVDLKLQFRAFGGAEIDPNSIVVTYLKEPAIDLTQRMRPFITPQGVDISQAEVPPGKHQIWVELKDKNGHIGTAEIVFQVGK